MVHSFICPDGEQIEVAKCLDSSVYGCRMKRRCASRQYLQMISQERPRKYLCQQCRKELLVDHCPDCNIEALSRFSTTQLINGTMSAFLKLTEDYCVSPDSRAFLLHGTKAHTALETSGDDLSLLEEKLEMNDITGIADALEEENGEIRLIDTKTSGSYKISRALGLFTYDMKSGEVYRTGPRKGEPKTVKGLKFGIDNIDMEDWVLQLNAYRLMYLEKGYKVDKLFIFAVVRDGGTRAALSRGIVRNTYLIPVRMMNDDVVREYFDDKKTKLLKALDQGYWEEPCNEVENWNGTKCKRFCEVWEHCPLGRMYHEQQTNEEDEDMPVGYTNNIRLQSGGSIKLGDTVTNDKGISYPTELSYFKLAPTTPDEKVKNDLIAEYEREYGKDPTSIVVELPPGLSPNSVEEILSGNYESVFPQNYYRYIRTAKTKAGLLLCSNARQEIGYAKCIERKYATNLKVLRSNIIKTKQQGKDIDIEECYVECLMEECPYRHTEPTPQCVPKAFLNVILPRLHSMNVWTIRTSSYNSISNINSFLSMIAFILKQAGIYTVSGVPIRLERRPQEMNHNRIVSTHYPIFVDTEQGISIAEIQKLVAKSGNVRKAIGLEPLALEEAAAEETGDGELPPATAIIDGETGEVITQPTEESPVEGASEEKADDIPPGLTLDMLNSHTRQLATVLQTQNSNLVKYQLQSYEDPMDALVDFDKALNDAEYQIAFNEKFSTWLASSKQDSLI